MPDTCRLIGGLYCCITAIVLLGFVGYSAVTVHDAIVNGLGQAGTKLTGEKPKITGTTAAKADEFAWFRHDPFDSGFSLNMPTGHAYEVELCSKNKEAADKVHIYWTLWSDAAKKEVTSQDYKDNLRELVLDETSKCGKFDSSKFRTAKDSNGTTVNLCPTLSSIYIGFTTATDGTAEVFDFDSTFTEVETPDDDLCTGIWLWLGKFFLYVFIAFVACGSICLITGGCCCVTSFTKKRNQYEVV